CPLREHKQQFFLNFIGSIEPGPRKGFAGEPKTNTVMSLWRNEMKRWLAAGMLLGMTPILAASPQEQKQEAAKISLKVGDAAPDFTLLSDQWKTVKLSDFRGKKNVLLAVYVLAFTGGLKKHIPAVQA